MKTQITIAAVLAFGSSAALADEMAKKAPEAKKVEPKVEPKKDAPKPAEMPIPKPDPQVAALAKQMAGTWKCTGKVLMDPSQPMVDAKATITHKLSTNLGGFWIESTLEAPMGKMNYRFVAYTTYNPAEKKWLRYSVDNMGGVEWASSAGPKEGKTVWEGDAIGQVAMGGSHKMKSRATEDVSDPKLVKIKGEMSMDGKTWMTGHEVSCKK